MKKILLLYSLLITLFLLENISNIKLIGVDYDNFSYRKFIEIIQELTLIFCIFIIIKKFKFLSLYFGKINIIIKSVFFAFLIYEELSYLTRDFCHFCSNFNEQSEFNLHNSFLIGSSFIKNISFPIIGEVSTYTFIYSSFCLMICFGKYIPFIKRIKGFFLAPKYYFLALIFIIERFISLFMVLIGFTENYEMIIFNQEYCELLLYLSLLCDLLDKIKLSKIDYVKLRFNQNQVSDNSNEF
tara:strand:+ start:33 stop:755 length:723 start_codon:yes stop_codon:yes gene_type:complete